MLMTDTATIRQFIEAGKARVTLSSKKTGARFTYQFKRIKPEDAGNAACFVSLLTGADNENAYSYIGLYDPKAPIAFRWTKKSNISEHAPSFKAVSFFANKVLACEAVPESLEVRHENRCGKCARPLTTPESIDRGIGPECWEKMGGF